MAHWVIDGEEDVLELGGECLDVCGRELVLCTEGVILFDERDNVLFKRVRHGSER